MRVRELVACAALAGCISNPDPRHPTLEMKEREGFGSYIEVTTRQHYLIAGELIAVDRDLVRVLRPAPPNRLVAIPIGDVIGADLYTYESDSGFGGWGIAGGLSTLTHGFFLALSLPVWIAVSAATAATESRHVLVSFPDDPWPALAKWARFPQGAPPGLDEQALVVPRVYRGPPGTPAPAPLTRELQLARERAWMLTKQAAAAARAGDCTAVRTLSEQIRAIDLDFHDTVFLRDVAILRCMGP